MRESCSTFNPHIILTGEQVFYLNFYNLTIFYLRSEKKGKNKNYILRSKFDTIEGNILKSYYREENFKNSSPRQRMIPVEWQFFIYVLYLIDNIIDQKMN